MPARLLTHCTLQALCMTTTLFILAKLLLLGSSPYGDSGTEHSYDRSMAAVSWHSGSTGAAQPDGVA